MIINEKTYTTDAKSSILEHQIRFRINNTLIEKYIILYPLALIVCFLEVLFFNKCISGGKINIVENVFDYKW